MKQYTTNIACKHVKSIHFGGRRRQCVVCHATWRIRSKKRGPKRIKRRTTNLQRTFVDGLTIIQQARRSSLNERSLAKRRANDLESLCGQSWPHSIPQGHLILVIDAMWFGEDEKRNTVYFVGLRKVDGDELCFLRPVLYPGHESQIQWRKAIALIPEEVKKRILAMVSDSFRGAEGMAKEHGWIFQRCQAHLLLRLETLCGDNKRAVSFWEGRQEIKRLAYALMNTQSEAKTEKTVIDLARLGNRRDCPNRLHRIVSETLRRLHEYRACYLHPELCLPATTNAIENTNGRIRSLLNHSRGCRTPRSLIQWITGFLYFHPTVKCRPKLPTKIKR